MSRKVIIAAPEETLLDFFADQYPDWDFQKFCTSIPEVWDGLSDGTLDDQSSVVLLCDEIYRDDPEGFAEAAAEFAPNALVLILSYDKELQDDIQNDILRQKANLEYRRTHGINAPFEFIWYETAVVSIDEAIDYHENQSAAVDAFRKAESKAQSIEVDEGSSDHHRFGRNGKVITVTSSKGGSGKTTAALLLATQLSLSSKKAHEQGLIEEPLRVCVVDLDTFDGQIGFVLNAARPTALNIALANTPKDTDLVWNNLVYSERMGFHALLAPVRGVTARYTDARFYTEVISYLRSMFDVVVLDTSVQHYDEIIDRVALPLADAVLLVTTLDVKSVKGLARWLQVAAESREEGGHALDMRKVGVVVNGSIHGVGIGSDELTAASMGAPLLVSIPMESKAVQTAGNAGRLEEIVKTHPTLGEAYFKLANKMHASVLANQSKLLPLVEDDDGPVAINPKSNRTAGNTSGSGKPSAGNKGAKKPRRFFGK